MDYEFQTEFTKTDHFIFDLHCQLAEAVAKLVGSHCEVVVHSLEDVNHSILKIVNNHVSGRPVGGPLTNLCFDLIKDSEKTGIDVIGPYYSLSTAGKTIRSLTTIIRGEHNRPIGLLCFNMDLSVPFDSLMREYLGDEKLKPFAVTEIYPRSLEELIHYMLEEAVNAANELKGASAAEKNTTAIQIMAKKGVFRFKGAIDIVSQELGVSRTTVYNYLREARIPDEEQD